MLAVHRQTFSEFRQWPVWQLEVYWLNKDHAAAIKLMNEHRDGVFKSDRYRWKLNRYMVRCLIKLGRFAEAIAHAEGQIKNKYDHAVPLVLAHAATQDVKQTMAVLERFHHQRYLLEDCYRDEDLGPILRSDRFRALRERFPEPKISGSTRQFDDNDSEGFIMIRTGSVVHGVDCGDHLIVIRGPAHDHRECT